MEDTSQDKPADIPLNPALKSQTDTVYDTTTVTPAPIDTASAKEGEGEGWPVVWLTVALICVVFAIYFLL